VSAEGEQLSFEGVGGAQEQAADAAATEDLGFEATAEQVAAIESRDHDAFLEAGAGSCKTSLLVDRYCSAVL
jgi:hypothetical protein